MLESFANGFGMGRIDGIELAVLGRSRRPHQAERLAINRELREGLLHQGLLKRIQWFQRYLDTGDFDARVEGFNQSVLQRRHLLG